MSIEAIVWAQDWAPVDDQVSAFVLNALARSAKEDGTAARPSKETIMWRTRLSESSVKRGLRKLQKEGLIRLGDQSLAAHIPADRRPTVWDLDMSRRRQSRPVREGRRGPIPDDDEGPHRPPVDATGGLTDRIGGSVGPDRGVTETGTGGLTDPQEVLGESFEKPIRAHDDDRKSGKKTPSKHEVLEATIDEVRQATGTTIPVDWAQRVRACILEDAEGHERDVGDEIAYLRKAIRDEPDPRGRFLPSLHATPEARERPPWCGHCDERTRLAEDDTGRPKRCTCHPLHGQPLARPG